jgi:hypothetical protein
MWIDIRRALALVVRTAALVPVSLLASGPAAAVLDVDSQITCQAEAGAGTMLNVDVRLENAECVAVDVRVFSAAVGNTDQMVDGLGVFGPVLAREISIPAARDRTPGYCNPLTNMCGGWGGTSNLSCSTNADCFCRLYTPTILNISMAVPPALPDSLANTVVTQLVTVEWDGGTRTDIQECVIEIDAIQAATGLPEPAGGLQLVTGTLGLLALSRLRGGGIDCRRLRRRSSRQGGGGGGTNQLKEKYT